jgi:hypothetical protein
MSNRPARGALGWRSVMAGCGEMFGVERRCVVAERGMGSRRVVLDPASDHPSRLVEIEEERLIQQVAHAAERFDIAVLRRFAGCNVVPFDPVALRPAEDRVRGKLDLNDSSSFSNERELTHEVQQAVVCRRLPPLRSASVVEYWNTQCARRRSCLSYLRGRSDG